MFSEEQILKLAKRLNIEIDNLTAQIISEYANKGDATVGQIRKAFLNAGADALLARARFFIYSNTISFSQFKDVLTNCNLQNLQYNTIRRCYKIFSKQNLTYTQTNEIMEEVAKVLATRRSFSQKTLINIINEQIKLYKQNATNMFLSSTNSVTQSAEDGQDDKPPVSIPDEQIEIPLPIVDDSDVPAEMVEESQIDIEEVTNAFSQDELYSALSIELLAIQHRFHYKGDNKTWLGEAKMCNYNKTAIYTIYNQNNSTPYTTLYKILRQMQTFTNLLCNATNFTRKGKSNIQELMFTINSTLPMIEALVNQASLDIEKDKLEILNISSLIKRNKREKYEIKYLKKLADSLAKYKSKTQDEYGSQIQQTLDETNNQIQKENQSIISKRLDITTQKEFRDYYIESIVQSREIINKLNILKQTLIELLATIEAKTSNKQEVIDEATIKEQIATLEDEIKSLTKDANRSEGIHKAKVKDCPHPKNSSVEFSAKIVEKKKQRLANAKAELARLKGLLNNYTV